MAKPIGTTKSIFACSRSTRIEAGGAMIGRKTAAWRDERRNTMPSDEMTDLLGLIQVRGQRRFPDPVVRGALGVRSFGFTFLESTGALFD